jgi:hypothetical protein
MSNNQDPLSQLWQEQKVEKIDLDAISKKWRKIKLKQHLYVFFDLLCLLPFLIVVIYFKDKFDGFTIVYMYGLTVMSLGFVIYVIWLRRFSLGWSKASTEQHIQGLRKQLLNNIKIALLTKHSMWFALIVIIFHQVGLIYLEVFPPDKLLRKALISFSIIGVMWPAVWIWADKRAKRFKRELSIFNELVGAAKSE